MAGTRAILKLKKGRERARVHPWIFKGDVADVTAAGDGDAVTVVDAAGRFVGRGLFNSRPALCCRILTWADEPIDGAFFARRAAAALDARAGGDAAAGDGAAARRLVWSEADGLSGFVADRYAGVLVVQCVTLGMARRRADLVKALRARLGDLPAFAADDAYGARLEGFEPMVGWVDAAGPASVVVDERGVRLGVRFGTGHKTGLYLDQADNRARVGALARDRDVLDVFAYTAGFACHALAQGGRRAVCIESSPEAIAGARENLALNGLAERAEIRDGNAFDELRRLDRDPARFGLVVLDPPPFARSRTAVEPALRGYKEINLRAMRLLAPGGVLATFSCSHHVGLETFTDMCRDAATDAGVTLRVRDTLRQSADHPILLTVPETGYLKGLLLEAL
jgi:23S rRNA (cytosine1962-C5)-methyltransferase